MINSDLVLESLNLVFPQVPTVAIKYVPICLVYELEHSLIQYLRHKPLNVVALPRAVCRHNQVNWWDVRELHPTLPMIVSENCCCNIFTAVEAFQEKCLTSTNEIIVNDPYDP